MCGNLTIRYYDKMYLLPASSKRFSLASFFVSSIISGKCMVSCVYEPRYTCIYYLWGSVD